MATGAPTEMTGCLGGSRPAPIGHRFPSKPRSFSFCSHVPPAVQVSPLLPTKMYVPTPTSCLPPYNQN